MTGIRSSNLPAVVTPVEFLTHGLVGSQVTTGRSSVANVRLALGLDEASEGDPDATQEILDAIQALDEEKASVASVEGVSSQLAGKASVEAVAALENELSFKASIASVLGLSDLVNTKASTASVDALSSQVSFKASIASVLGLSDQVDEKASASSVSSLSERVDSLDRTPIAGTEWRPGEFPRLFTASLAGAPESVTPLTSANVVTNSSDGRLMKIVGAGYVASVEAPRCEPSRRYRIRFVGRKLVNSSEPSIDGVVLGVQWLNSSYSAVSQTILGTIYDWTSAAGRREYQYTVASQIFDELDAVMPPGAICFRPFVRSTGDNQFGVEVIEAIDLAGAVLWSPDVADLMRENAALSQQIQALTDRVETLEA